MKKYAAEFLGTFWLVLGGCGSAVLAAAFPDVGIGFLGVSLAFGLTVLTMAFAIGHISGCHLNPAVSVGLWAAGRFPAGSLLPYIAAQVLGAIAPALLSFNCEGRSGLRSRRVWHPTDTALTRRAAIPCRRPRDGSGDDVVFPGHHPRRDRRARPPLHPLPSGWVSR